MPHYHLWGVHMRLCVVTILRRISSPHCLSRYPTGILPIFRQSLYAIRSFLDLFPFCQVSYRFLETSTKIIVGTHFIYENANDMSSEKYLRKLVLNVLPTLSSRFHINCTLPILLPIGLVQIYMSIRLYAFRTVAGNLSHTAHA